MRIGNLEDMERVLPLHRLDKGEKREQFRKTAEAAT